MAVNQLKAGALLSYLSLGISNVIGILYTPFLLRMLGQSEYGLYSLVISVVAYLSVLDFGFGNAIVRYTAKYRAENKLEEIYSLLGMFLVIYSFIGLIAFCAGSALYFNVENLFGNTMTLNELSRAKTLMLLMIFNVGITFPLSMFGAVITAYQDFIFQRLANILRVILQPLIMIPILLLGYKSIALVIVITILNIVFLLVNCWYCFYKLKIRLYFNAFKWDTLKELSNYSVWIFMAIIIDRIYWSTGQFVLGAFVGTAAVAVFAIAIQLQGYYTGFSNALASVFLPKLTTMVSQNSSDKDLSDLFIRIGRIQFVILGMILSGFILFGQSFILLWAGKEYEQSYMMTLLLMVPLTVPLIQCIGMTILQAQAKLKFRSYTYLVIAILSLFLSIPLAKQYGGIGCAIGTGLCLFLGNGIAMNIYYKREIHLDIFRFWREIGKMAIPLIPLMMVIVFEESILSTDSLFSLLSKMGIYCLAYLFVISRFSMNVYERDLFGKPIQKLLKKVRVWK